MIVRGLSDFSTADARTLTLPPFALFFTGHLFLPDSTSDTADLLIGADGGGSTVRQRFLKDVQYQYAGYVAYRGLVDESELDRETAALFTERFVFYQFLNSHILQYVVPGADKSLIPGERRFNWVWYVNYDEATELPRILTDKAGSGQRTPTLFAIKPVIW